MELKWLVLVSSTMKKEREVFFPLHFVPYHSIVPTRSCIDSFHLHNFKSLSVNFIYAGSSCLRASWYFFERRSQEFFTPRKFLGFELTRLSASFVQIAKTFPESHRRWIFSRYEYSDLSVKRSKASIIMSRQSWSSLNPIVLLRTWSESSNTSCKIPTMYSASKIGRCPLRWNMLPRRSFASFATGRTWCVKYDLPLYFWFLCAASALHLYLSILDHRF